jgi:hypothetical protein
MKQVIRTIFFDVEKEENWLNRMSAMGLALIDYSWCRYVFEQAPPNEYIYRIEMLENHHIYSDSAAYIQFLEENGVECVAKYARWVYLRKKAADGPFDIYTDIESRYRYYKRVSLFYRSLFIVKLVVGLMNLGIGIANNSALNLVLAIPVLCLAALVAKINEPFKVKARKYEQERMIRE